MLGFILLIAPMIAVTALITYFVDKRFTASLAVCFKCNGKKVVIVDSGSGFKVEATCDQCNGSGKSREVATCKTCNDAQTIISDVGGGLNVEVDCPDCNATTVINS